MRQLDNSNRCEGCKNPNGYCVTYIGPLFDQSSRKILFIGLDSGTDGNGSSNYQDWQQRVLCHYRNDQKSWRPHYKGCVFMAADILGLDGCQAKCRQRCSNFPVQSCALTHFAQGNAVKCVIPKSKTSEFKQKDLIPSCLPLIFEEAAQMQPDVIILQGSGIQDQFYALLGSHKQVGDEILQPHEEDYSGIMAWSDPPNKKTIIVHAHHPSAPQYWGNFQKYVDHIAPRLETIRRFFGNRLQD